MDNASNPSHIPPALFPFGWIHDFGSNGRYNTRYVGRDFDYDSP